MDIKTMIFLVMFVATIGLCPACDAPDEEYELPPPPGETPGGFDTPGGPPSPGAPDEPS